MSARVCGFCVIDVIAWVVTSIVQELSNKKIKAEDYSIQRAIKFDTLCFLWVSFVQTPKVWVRDSALNTRWIPTPSIPLAFPSRLKAPQTRWLSTRIQLPNTPSLNRQDSQDTNSIPLAPSKCSQVVPLEL